MPGTAEPHNGPGAPADGPVPAATEEPDRDCSPLARPAAHPPSPGPRVTSDPVAALAELAARLPAYAADTRTNLERIVAAPGAHLTAPQHWGTVLATAAAVRSPAATAVLAAVARARLDDAAAEAALGAATLMATHNVYFRARHFLGYDDQRAGLRMRRSLSPGVPPADFEVWCTAVSAVAGCEACVVEHEAGARRAGLSREAVNDALRVAAVVAGVSAVIDSAALL